MGDREGRGTEPLTPMVSKATFGWTDAPSDEMDIQTAQIGLAKLDSPEGPGSKIMDMIMVLYIRYFKVY